jgi:hypothetical protein
MKKVILFSAIMIGSLAMYAMPDDGRDIVSIVAIQDEYTEVKLDALPAAVTSTVEKSFPNTKLEKAYVNQNNEYKIEISKGDSKFTVYTDASGNIIKK